MADEFEGKFALVTGAASGIGLATARLLASRGVARITAVDLAAGPADIGAGTSWLSGSVADETFWDDIAPELEGLDFAVVNAGVSSAGAIAELDFAEWRRVMAVNLDGAFLTLRAALRAMREGGGIVVTSSVSGVKAEPGTAAYGASKAGVLQLCRVAAKEAATRGIRVNAIAPGGVATPIWRGMAFFDDLVREKGGEAAAFDAMAKMATPLGRYATADEIAGQIVFLLSDVAATITGATLTSDGGYSL